MTRPYPYTGAKHWAPILNINLSEQTMPILTGFPASNTISPTITVSSSDFGYGSTSTWQYNNSDAGSWGGYYSYSSPSSTPKKNPKFVVEIFEEEVWQS